MAVADPQLIDMRHRRPAAAGDDLVVGRDRLLGELLGRRRQHRRRSFRHMDGARGLVEILAELAGTAIVHQRVERVVGEGAAGEATEQRSTSSKTPQEHAAAKVHSLLYMSWGERFSHGHPSHPCTAILRLKNGSIKKSTRN